METQEIKIGIHTFFLRKNDKGAYVTVGTRGNDNISLADLEQLIKELRRFGNAS